METATVKDGNLKLSLKVAKLLKKNGVTVVMTRDDDSTVSSEDRAAIANDSNADLYLALHRNYAANPEACGVEAWIYSSGSEKNHAIAETILSNLEKVGISDNRGVRTGTQFDSDNDYIVIKQTNMTSLIIEMGFISNEKDVELYDDNMDDYAAAIANGIIEWLNEYVDDIMSTALDSSMLQCWCSEVNVVGRYLGEYASEQISRGGELELYEIEEETYRSLTLENFKTGLLKYFSEDYTPVARRHDGTWGVDPGMIDEIAADEIIQYALFEEIVYS